MRVVAILSACLFGFLIETPPASAEEPLAQIKSTFARPPRDYSTSPLWVWNDLLSESQVVGTLRDLAAQQVKQVFVHPRPGLMTPYLSDDWFRLWKRTLEEARRLDMNVWIYDENSYPSGFAGGWVPEALPDSRAQSLVLKQENRLPAAGDEVVALFRLKGDQFERMALPASHGAKPAPGPYLVARRVPVASTPWFAGKWYVDLLKPGVTEKFLEVTLEPYRQRFGAEFGKRLPGSFTDEPHLAAAGNGFHWTADLPDAFRKRWGYDLLDQLPALVRNVGQWKRVRHNLMQTLNELYIERWAKPYYGYCQRHGLQFTGHYWEHNWPRCESVPDNMAMAAWQHAPGIDCLMNQYREDNNAQFGNARMVRELASVANQLGRKRRLCEIYGAGGWDLRFEDMKRIGDWLGVLGVNLFDEHLSYVTLRGARKNDHPQSFSYHEPWWNDYHLIAQYLTRLSYAMSLGEQVNRILVLEPTTTAWMYQFAGDAAQKESLKQVGDSFFNLLMALESATIGYDLGCEEIMADHGRVEKGGLQVGQRRYQAVVLPAGTESVNRRTAELLEAYLGVGGTVLSAGPPPARIDGQTSDRLLAAAKQPRWITIKADQLPEMLKTLVPATVKIQRAPNDAGKLFHQLRVGDFGSLLLLVNTSIDAPSAGVVEAGPGAVEEWDLESGAIRPRADCSAKDKVVVPFNLAPCGSLLLRLGGPAPVASPASAGPTPTKVVVPKGSPIVTRLEPNVLVIDYVDLKVAGQTKPQQYYYQAAQAAFAANGMERNPWDSAVQFHDELIRKTFSPGSGFDVTYHFTIRGKVPSGLQFVVERPDLYTITCNGQAVKAIPDAWWLDRAFGRIDIASLAREGDNSVTLKAAPMTIFHEIERAYVLGDFTLEPAAKGFVIAAAKPLQVREEGWNRQGHPFYAAGVSYAQRYEIDRLHGQYNLRLPAWYGSVARVLVDGKPAGHIYRQPFECDITSCLHPGTNRVEVVVVGTLKNTLGPHHGSPPLGTAWPAMFRKGPAVPPPGSEYHTVDYGLRSAFELRRAD